METKRTNKTTFGNLTATVRGTMATGYHAIVETKNGTRLWESMMPFAFRDAALQAAQDRARRMAN